MGNSIPGNRRKLRLFYLALCLAQLVVMATGLGVAFQVERSYYRNIGYENAIDTEHQAIDELQVFARSAKPTTLDLDDSTSGPTQLSKIAYASSLFIGRAQQLLKQAEASPDSPMYGARADIRAMIEQMNVVAEQGRLAGDAWAHNDSTLAVARLTYADRASERVYNLLADVHQQMSAVRDKLLERDNRDARRADMVLGPLSILGIFLVLPALLYVRRLDRNIWSYETEVENQRRLLEERVALRTAELRSEIESRERMESFNTSRNQLLERVAEGKDLDGILTQLIHAAEQSVKGGKCLILMGGSHSRPVIAPSLAPDLAAQLESALLQCWDTISSKEAANRGALFLRDLAPPTGVSFDAAWSQGYRAVLAVPILEPNQPLLGVIALLLPEKREADEFARSVLLSASRMASVALKHEHMQDELFRRAHFDPLTELPNRVLFEDRLQQAVALAARRKTQVGILCIDLDGFKQVNDGHGHHIGDLLLREVAKRLQMSTRKTDSVSRLSGDEFAAVVQETHNGEGVARVSEVLIRALAEPYNLGGTVVRITASIGAALFPTDGASSAELRRYADLALYRAKERGRNTFEMFSAELGQKLERRKQIEVHLQEALDGRGFELHYQPIYRTDGMLVAMEALIRFRRAELKSISPGEFMAVAEQTGFVLAIGEWVIREACRQSRQWKEAGYPAVALAVNVSAIQLGRPNFAERVTQILKETGVSPEGLHVEVTETAVMSDFDAGLRTLTELANLGVKAAIDDFGTGHSSLSYIHRLPIKAVKIDRSFVQNMVVSQESLAIVRAIVAMSQSLGLLVIAEGVETQQQKEAVASAGCNAAQGYLFSLPLNAAAAEKLLARAQVPAAPTAPALELAPTGPTTR